MVSESVRFFRKFEVLLTSNLVASAVLFNHLRFRHGIPFANYTKGTASTGR
jgi:hypothetical protein